MTIYTIYKTTNTVNGKIYIGSHKQNINEELYFYIGSGKYFKRALNKYGEDKFFKKIIHVFDNSEDMYDMEAEIVNQEFIDRRDTYNIKLGGLGGWDLVNVNYLYTERVKRGRYAGKVNSIRMNSDKEYYDEVTSRFIKYVKTAHIEGKIRYDTFTGKNHTTESKNKMSISRRKDLSIYHLKNKETNELFSGTRYEFTEKYNLLRTSVNSLITNEKKSLYGWYIL